MDIRYENNIMFHITMSIRGCTGRPLFSHFRRVQNVIDVNP